MAASYESGTWAAMAAMSSGLTYGLRLGASRVQAYDGMGHAAYENMEATGGAPGGGPGGPFPGAGFQVRPKSCPSPGPLGSPPAGPAGWAFSRTVRCGFAAPAL